LFVFRNYFNSVRPDGSINFLLRQRFRRLRSELHVIILIPFVLMLR